MDMGALRDSPRDGGGWKELLQPFGQCEGRRRDDDARLAGAVLFGAGEKGPGTAPFGLARPAPVGDPGEIFGSGPVQPLDAQEAQ